MGREAYPGTGRLPKDPTPGTGGRQDELFTMPTATIRRAQKRAHRPSKLGSSGTTRIHAYNGALTSLPMIMPAPSHTYHIIVSYVDVLITRHVSIGAQYRLEFKLPFLITEEGVSCLCGAFPGDTVPPLSPCARATNIPHFRSRTETLRPFARSTACAPPVLGSDLHLHSTAQAGSVLTHQHLQTAL